MPRAILTYRLPQEADEFQAAVDGAKWREVVRELDGALRSWEKHGAVPSGVDVADPAPGLREWLFDAMSSRGLILHE